MTVENASTTGHPPNDRQHPPPILNRPSHPAFVMVAAVLNLLFTPTYALARFRAARVARQQRGVPVLTRRSYVGGVVVVMAAALVVSQWNPLWAAWISPEAAAVDRSGDDAQPVPTVVSDPAAPVATSSPSATGQQTVQSDTGTWVAPVRGPIVSGFRPPDRRDHDGVDVAAPRGMTIRAASAGVVFTVLCNVAGRSHTPNSAAKPCDRDGRPGLGGCGWYVEIRHADDIVSRYCHMAKRPVVQVGHTVVAGQAIGQVGSSGNSSGPHLHLEIHLRRVAPNNPKGVHEPVDPVGFLAQRKVKLQTG